MTYFAQVQDGIVQQVIVAEQDFIDTLPIPSEWYLTDVNAYGGVGYRANYAGIGFTYDATNNVFYAPAPYTDWILNTKTWLWEAPIPYPQDGKDYQWDENTDSWKLVPDAV